MMFMGRFEDGIKRSGVLRSWKCGGFLFGVGSQDAEDEVGIRLWRVGEVGGGEVVLFGLLWCHVGREGAEGSGG